MEWKNDNQLELRELREAIRNDDILCAVIGCENPTSDVHHLDSSHKNNEPPNLAPACKLCHDKVHGISADMNDLKLLTREFYEIQKFRKSLANRIGAYERLGIPLNYCPLGLEDIKGLETKLKKHIIALLKPNLFYNSWLKHVKGIGPLLSASLMAELGSPERFNTVGQLWAYSGMHVVDGEAPRRKRGEMANWNAQLRMTLYKVASSFIKYDCFGRKLYDEYKAYYIKRDGAEPKWKPHRRAMRRVMKDFERCMWRAWMISRDLPLSEPHAETRVFENDWM